ncbi:MAG: hypothetical protein A49_03820 [Methyloceanibacter sp.]|nr:MAG: hypothetical protein A49_03820 [Methyloceanibacter sp.]
MRILKISSAAGLAAALIALSPVPVSAGLFDSAASSYKQQSRVVGRHLVSFPPGYEAGMILVQFSRARLYYVLPNQRAISYPIAIPKGEARWSGDTYVSEKRVNPGWTRRRRCGGRIPIFLPTFPAAILRTRSGSGRSISATPSTAFTARTRLVGGPGGLSRLHPDVQSGRGGSLSARARRNPCRGDMVNCK